MQKTETKKSLLANTQGAHAAMRLNMEQTILSQYRRLPGFHSEFMGLEIMNESMTTVGVEDILNGACCCGVMTWPIKVQDRIILSRGELRRSGGYLNEMRKLIRN